MRPRLTPGSRVGCGLPEVRFALAVVAHPDDESFGLGAVLSALIDAGCAVSTLCFTHGEASTLGEFGADLHSVRSTELTAAAEALGVGEVELLGYPDGQLSGVPLEELAGLTVTAAKRCGAELLVAFDQGGITGHPDHEQATKAAMLAADRLGLPVLGWSVTEGVAAALNSEQGTTFAGEPPERVDITIKVDRHRQLDAIRCHKSQSTLNPVLWRRLELTGDFEFLRWLRHPA